MPRIFTDQPSDGKPINIFVPATFNNGFVNTDWTELAEAVNFSIPFTGANGAVLDSNDDNREIRGGETYFETPITCYNYTGTPRWVQFEMALPSIGAAFQTGHFIPAGTGGGASGRVFMCSRAAALPRIYDVATDTLSIPTEAFGPGSYNGSVKLSDNRIYMIPFGGGSNQPARIYNPATDSFTTPNGVFPSSFGQGDGVLMADGRVFILPYNDTQARVYDPTANTLTPAGGTYVPVAHLSAVRLASGKIFMPPHNAGRAAVYDPTTNTKTNVGPAYPAQAFFGAVLLTSGKVFMVPGVGQRGAVYDPAGAGSITSVDATKWDAIGQGFSGYVNGARLPDGRVYLNGVNTTQGRIWDPVTDVSTIPSGQFSADADHLGLVTLGDGRIYLIPFNSTSAKIYNPTANTLTTPSGAFPNIAERITVTSRLVVPANGTISVPLQGQRLLCPARGDANAQGGKLLVSAEVNNAIKVFGSAIEMEAASHAPNTEI
jgi:hypothetical protein